MKNLILSFTIIILFSSLTSCTAEEIQPVKNTTSASFSAKDGVIDSPKPTQYPKP